MKVRCLLLVKAKMAQKGFELSQGAFCCPICVDLLKEPVLTPCGHSYCKDCIKAHWDTETAEGTYSCPLCRQTFPAQPDLLNSIFLATLVEELRVGRDVSADHLYAGPDDLACDICTGRKLRAAHFCLVCLISFCRIHIRPHVESPAYKKHDLVEPSEKLRENICSHHNELRKMFCRTDQQLICYLCSVEEHKGHATVSAAAETTEKQKELDTSRKNLRERIKVLEEELKVLRAESEAVNRLADKTAEDIEEILTGMISDVKRKVRSKQEGQLSQLKELQEQAGQEIIELKRRDAELKVLSHTEDHILFLSAYTSLPGLAQATGIRRPPGCFEDVTAAVSELRDKLQEVLKQEWTSILPTQVEVPLSEPKIREDFLKHFCQITLDPNTTNQWLFLSEDYKSGTLMRVAESYPLHPDRFSDWHQVLSTKILTGCRYWEVEMTGCGICVAVSYKNIRRAWRSPESGFGLNEKSWTLNCYNGVYDFWHNNIRTPVSGPRSSTVGVYLDHDAGSLSFYSVSGTTMTFLHRVQTTFTQPLYAGLGFLCYETTAEILTYEGPEEEDDKEEE